MKISVVIIAYNEERHLVRCLESVASIATEIIVVDSYSTDETAAIAQKHGAKVYQRTFDGYIGQKNYVNTLAKGDYIFSLDADEALSSELIRFLQDEQNYVAYDILSFHRLNQYCGKWMKFGGWYPDIKVRMWKRGMAHWGGSLPHEHVIFDSSLTHRLVGHDILHYAYNTVKQHIAKSDKYAQLASYQYINRSYFELFFKMFFSGGFRFFRNCFLKLGILDGWRGIVSAFITMIEINNKYWLALEKKINRS
jgi:glycosyltransferase involved in cell wall biosynthesis